MYIYHSGTSYCPVTLTVWVYLIPRLVSVANSHKAHKTTGISYTTAREAFARYIQPLAKDGLELFPHSLRLGGASSAAATGVEARLISKHGMAFREIAGRIYRGHNCL